MSLVSVALVALNNGGCRERFVFNQRLRGPGVREGVLEEVRLGESIVASLHLK